MSDFRVSEMRDNAILIINADRHLIHEEPDYQRVGDVWTRDKAQLLIDSILNGYDVPKIYFHEFVPMKEINGKLYKYAIIDGRQRLQAIWGFINGDFPLSKDFEYINDDSIKAAGLTYNELGKKYPRLKIQFDGCGLTIVTIQTNDTELIEDMFSRLNEAVPLNAAEKRNALGGPLPSVIRDLANAPFFEDRIPFKNARYRYLDLATKFLYFEHLNGIADTKKNHLDKFFIGFHDRPKTDAESLYQRARSITDKMASVFINNDPLLKSVGMIVLFYLVFRAAVVEGWVDEIGRSQVDAFDRLRSKNRLAVENNQGEADYELIEFDRLTQSPNDALALRYRYRVFRKFLNRPVSYPSVE